MSRLKVSLRGALISELHLIPEKEYIGGRKEGSDIRLQAEKGISREHFRLKFTEGHWHLQTISRFGEVYSLGQRIEDIILEHNQSFQIPPYEFQFLEIPDNIDISLSDQEFATVDENTKTAVGVVPQVPYVKIVNGVGEVLEMLRLEVGDIWSAGRDPSCQIVIADQRVSRRQFEIRKINGIYTIIDLASVNGTFLNGSPISSTDPQPLKSGDAITVLDNQMFFELHDPNFKFKVEKIDVSPIGLVSESVSEESFTGATNTGFTSSNYRGNFDPTSLEVGVAQTQVPTYDPGYTSDQLQTEGGPFTGMPGADPSQNQYYDFNQAPPPVKPTGWQKLKQNKPLLIALVLAFLAGAYYLSEEMNAEPESHIAQGTDPFTQLTASQQKEVIENYTLGEQMMAQNKYDLAEERFRKINDLLKNGYKDSVRLQKEAQQSYASIMLQMEDDKMIREREEQARLFEEVAERCNKLLTPNVEMNEIDQCLQPIAALDLTNSDYIRIKSEAERLITDRHAKEDAKKNHEEQVAEMRSLFNKAQKTQQDGYAFKSIKQYKEVINSKLPDPEGLKRKAKKRIDFIQTTVEQKTSKSLTEADLLFQQGQHRNAVQLLREALVYDTSNENIKDRIDQYTSDLKRQMMTIYQESIIDESYGVIDSSNNRQGAKDKWKKIVETDLEDGEYYRKSIMKLRRYGVL